MITYISLPTWLHRPLTPVMDAALVARADATSIERQIVHALSQRITRSFLFACWSLALYDHALVFGVEVEKIWKARWTPVKCAYITIRICNLTYLVANVHSEYCEHSS